MSRTQNTKKQKYRCTHGSDHKAEAANITHDYLDLTADYEMLS
jgi:hypothetical protein